jgi:cysteine desulfurase
VSLCVSCAASFVLRGRFESKAIITSKIEHHAVLYTVQALQKNFIQVDYVAVKPNGEIDITNLVELLAENQKTLVSLMHVNEIGTVLDLDRIVPICKQYNALLHSDTVQSIGKEIDLQELPIDFLVASAHKFHGPKGCGICTEEFRFTALVFLVGAKKGMRPGTEAVHLVSKFSLNLYMLNVLLPFQRRNSYDFI